MNKKLLYYIFLCGSAISLASYGIGGRGGPDFGISPSKIVYDQPVAYCSDKIKIPGTVYYSLDFPFRIKTINHRLLNCPSQENLDGNYTIDSNNLFGNWHFYANRAIDFLFAYIVIMLFQMRHKRKATKL